jgi:hypothetical protein
VNWRYHHFVVGFVTRCGFHVIGFVLFVAVYGVVSDVARWSIDGRQKIRRLFCFS